LNVYCKITDWEPSRPNPHKKLKRFLGPAFTTSYVDKLIPLFGISIGDLITKYDRLLTDGNMPNSKASVETDLMEDLHNVALDMYVI